MKKLTELKKYIPLLILIIASIIAFKFIDLETFLNYKDQIISFTNQHIVLSGLLFGIIYTICVALSIPIATALTFLAGLLFGFIWGTLIVVISATIGACFIFLIVKHSVKSKSLLTPTKKDNKTLKNIQKNIKENEISYLLFVRLVPIFPFVLINIAPATIGTKLNIFFWTTLIGIIPGTAIYTYVGYSTGQIQGSSDIISPEIITGLTLLGILSHSPIIIKKILKKDKKNEK